MALERIDPEALRSAVAQAGAVYFGLISGSPRMQSDARRHLARVLASFIVALILISFGIQPAMAQGLPPPTGEGHCRYALEGSLIFACWNPNAGASIPENPGNYPEFLPNLHGWDYRINLPHVRYQTLRTQQGSPVTMIGVIEDAAALDLRENIPATPFEPGHRDNAFWLLREEHGKILFSQLPSRRNPQKPRNTASLTSNWYTISSGNSPTFRTQRVAAAVIGRGLGNSTLHVVAVDTTNRLWHNFLKIEQGTETTWSRPWQSLNIAARASVRLLAEPVPEPMGSAAPDPSTASLALAWVDMGLSARIQRYSGATASWSAPATIAANVDPYTPSILSNQQRLQVLFIQGARLKHTQETGQGAGTFAAPKTVSNFLPVYQGQYDALVFNNRIHIAVHTQTGEPANTGLFYLASKNTDGDLSWSIPSDTTLKTVDAPSIAALNENLFIVAADSRGLLTYTRKDPNRPDNAILGAANADHWLQAGLVIDPLTHARFSAPDLYAFNGDVYLTTLTEAFQANSTARILNFSRYAMKQLLVHKWNMRLIHGSEAAATRQQGPSSDIRMVGDVNSNAMSEVIRFAQNGASGVGPAPVFVSDAPWHTDFSRSGEIPLVGDFDGSMSNGKTADDIITFTQKAEYANGQLVATAPVYVALSDQAQFGAKTRWHTFFSLKGEIPKVGDFNCDGKDDIATFTQKRQLYANGQLMGNAPVWVALSNGTKFGTSSVWHTFFSLKGETPMVGDFNGDGCDDIATFIQQPYKNSAGQVIAQAPVWVALSEFKQGRAKFSASRIWHPYFSPRGEIPRVADINMDGKADIVTFVADATSGERAGNVYVAYSTGQKFETSVTFATDLGHKNDNPQFGISTQTQLRTLTGNSNDTAYLPDVFNFRKDGTLSISQSAVQVPYQHGAPWERYKWFTHKGLGMTTFPEWIYQGPHHCLADRHTLVLVGAGGSGGKNRTVLSVRIGSRAEHVLEEVGHSLFANCLAPSADPFNLYALVHTTLIGDGGLNSDNNPFCTDDFEDCRPSETGHNRGEHNFLKLLKVYRFRGDTFRARIATGPENERQARYQQYQWLKEHWFEGAEFKSAPSTDPTLETDYGVLCLPGECAVQAPPPVPTG